MQTQREDTLPLYRQFWPWFIISIPAATVVAAIITINIAIKTDDGLVVDDYYKEGLAINEDKARERKAREMQISAELSLDENGMIQARLPEKVAALPFLMLTLTYAVIGFFFFGQVTTFSGFGGMTGIDPPGFFANEPKRLYYAGLVLSVLAYVAALAAYQITSFLV